MKLTQEPVTNPALGPNLGGRTGLNFFQELLPNLVGLALLVGSLIFLAILIVGAIGWMTSGGDKAALESARSKISNAIVGFIVLLAVFAVVALFEYFFQIDILTLDIGPLKL